MKQVLAAHNMGDTLQGVIQNTGQVIACRCIPSAQNEVSPLPRICRNLPVFP